MARSCFAYVCLFVLFWFLKYFKNSSLLVRVHLIRSLALSRLSIIIIIIIVLFFCLLYFRIERWRIRFSVRETRVCAGEAVALDCRFGLLWRNGRSTHARLGCCWCIQRSMSIYMWIVYVLCELWNVLWKDENWIAKLPTGSNCCCLHISLSRSLLWQAAKLVYTIRVKAVVITLWISFATKGQNPSFFNPNFNLRYLLSDIAMATECGAPYLLIGMNNEPMGGSTVWIDNFCHIPSNHEYL